MTDLVVRLREAIDDAEVHPLHHLTCQMMKVPPEGFPFATFSCNCDGPDERLRRCSADRKILDLHAPTEYRTLRGGVTHVILQCNHCAGLCHSGSGLSCDEPCDAPYPCETVQIVAEAYGVEA